MKHEIIPLDLWIQCVDPTFRHEGTRLFLVPDENLNAREVLRPSCGQMLLLLTTRYSKDATAVVSRTSCKDHASFG